MEQTKINSTDTITAISTPQGSGGIAVIRISGPDAIAIADKVWHGRKLSSIPSHRLTLGHIVSPEGDTIDQAVAAIFIGPKSFTGEDVVEFSVHGSKWIQNEVLAILIRLGARIANPGEFTQRAFLNNRLDLAQAEGVADLIASSSKAAHRLAMSQTDGHFSKEFGALRLKLIEFASLLELELDFSEEDVEFADRQNLLQISEKILAKINRLANSFATGNALKQGVPVVIAGIPNAGKSSLLNLLLDSEKAIVTDVPGTTRDIIEDTAEINGILYRFYDTAGLRETSDTVESIGIQRALRKMESAAIIIWVIDPTATISPQFEIIDHFKHSNPGAAIITVLNKSDISTSQTSPKTPAEDTEAKIPYGDSLTTSGSDTETGIPGNAIIFSTKTREGFGLLCDTLHRHASNGMQLDTDIIITNARHYEALKKGSEALTRAIDAINAGISPDFIAQDVREALHHLGTITGAITTPDILTSIFSRFCIGK